MMTVTFEEVMLDWLRAEIPSPTWEAEFLKGNSHDQLNAFRNWLASTSNDALSPAERQRLVAMICQFRSPIVAAYGPRPDWHFEKRVVARAEFSAFEILSEWVKPGKTIGEYADHLRSNPSSTGHYAHVQGMLAAAARGIDPRGKPIALILVGRSAPLLIEGYKRTICALWDGKASLEYFVCTEPRLATR